MFTLLKWAAGAGSLIWLATTYGPMLGVSDSQVQQITATIDKAASAVATTEQKTQAETVLMQAPPTPEQLQEQAKSFLPVAVETIREGQRALQDAATQVREGMGQP